MSKKLSLLLFLSLSFELWSQQIPTFTQYDQNLSYFNPANTALTDKHFANLQSRFQWSGVERAPLSVFGQYEIDIDQFNSGVGAQYLHHRIGFFENHFAALSYRYKIFFNDKMSLNFGISIGVYQINLDPFFLPPTNTFDPNLPIGSQSQTKLNVNVGSIFQWKDLQVGMGLLQLNRASYDRISYTSVIHGVFHTAYTFRVSDQFELHPSAMFMMDPASFSFLITLKGVHYNRFWWRAGFRLADSIYAGLGIQFWERLQFGYSFDYVVSALSQYTFGSHECYLSFRIQK